MSTEKSSIARIGSRDSREGSIESVCLFVETVPLDNSKRPFKAEQSEMFSSAPLRMCLEMKLFLISYRALDFATITFSLPCAIPSSFRVCFSTVKISFFREALHDFRDLVTSVWTSFLTVCRFSQEKRNDKRGNNYTFIWLITQFELKSVRGWMSEIIGILFHNASY